MIRRIAVPFCLVSLLATPLAGQELQGREGSRFTWSERISSGQWLRVYGINGRIEVTQATGDAAEVIGEKVLRRGRPEDDGGCGDGPHTTPTLRDGLPPRD